MTRDQYPPHPGERPGTARSDRRSAEPDVRLRAHSHLLLDAGHPWTTSSAVLFCSASTISRWERRFEAEGVAAVFGQRQLPPTPHARQEALRALVAYEVVQFRLYVAAGSNPDCALV